MTGTPAERAAMLSARIHRRINDGGRPSMFDGEFWKDEFPQERAAAAHGFLDMAGDEEEPFYRLGAELRAIVLGNREGRR